MGKRTRLGDVIEIATAKGLAYAQYSLKVEKWGALLRVLPGFHVARPPGFRQLVDCRERFVTFFPLQAAVNRGIFEVVANESVPVHARSLPLFRLAGFVDRDGIVHDWWLWDGHKEWRVGKLTDEQRRLPILGVWNDTLLIQRVEQEWMPEMDAR